MTYQDRVRAFYMEKRGSLPTFEAAADVDFEEATEVEDAVAAFVLSEHPDLVGHLAKELADRMFTGYGLALSLGIDLDKAFDLVCQSNMTKEPTPEGKVKKGAGYVEPDMREALLGRPGK